MHILIQKCRRNEKIQVTRSHRIPSQRFLLVKAKAVIHVCSPKSRGEQQGWMAEKIPIPFLLFPTAGNKKGFLKIYVASICSDAILSISKIH